jgi:hypothetical protein
MDSNADKASAIPAPTPAKRRRAPVAVAPDVEAALKRYVCDKEEAAVLLADAKGVNPTYNPRDEPVTAIALMAATGLTEAQLDAVAYGPRQRYNPSVACRYPLGKWRDGTYTFNEAWLVRNGLY